MDTHNTLTDTLRKAGMRITPQRVAICKLLAETTEHPTAAAIYEEIKEQYSSLSLATVYNTLDALVAQGVVNVLGNAGDDKAHFDAHIEPHINLACIECHKIVDIPSSYVNQMDNEITQTSGYRLLGARVMYYGVCPDCQKNDTNLNQ